MKKTMITLFFLSIPSQAMAANTWYVRTDGGNPTQCDGLHDAASANGTNAPCAFNDINYVLGFRDGTGYRDPNSLRFKGGDTLIIDDVKHSDGSRASYVQGADMPGIVYGVCDKVNDRVDCEWGGIPGGPDAAHPSRILGKQWNSGCAQKPLMSQEGVYVLFNLSGSNIQISCLDLQGIDVSAPPSRGQYGIFADPALPLTNIKLTDLDVHGFRNTGILIGTGNQQGPIGDLLMDHVRVYGNSLAGIGTNNPGNGTITITNSVVEWTGCYEHFPQVNANIDDPANYYWCFSQGQYGSAPYASDQGYGDAIAFGPNGNVPSGNWVLDHDYVRWNTQDGFDSIHGLAGGTINVSNSWFEGNAGATIKIAAGNSKIENNLLIANCAFFDGQSFTATHAAVEGWGDRFLSCRAGAAIGFPAPSVADIQFYGNTVFSNQDVTIGYNSDGKTCTPNTHYRVMNNLFIGGTDWVSDVEMLGNFDRTDYHYAEGCDQATFEEDYNVGTNFKISSKFAGAHDKYVDPKITGMLPSGPQNGPSGNSALYYQGTNGGRQVYLAPGSLAIGAGRPMATIPLDFNDFPRANPPSVGAYEFGSKPTVDGGATRDGGVMDDGGVMNGGALVDGSPPGAAGAQPGGDADGKSGCDCSTGQGNGGSGSAACTGLLAFAFALVMRLRGRPRITV